MSGAYGSDIRRAIPPVDEVLASEEVARLRRRYPRFPWTVCVREALDIIRAEGVPSGTDRDQLTHMVVERIRRRVEELRVGGMRRVINGSGVILHTNLGRAVLGEPVRRAIDDAGRHYVNLETDLDSGLRCHRADTLNELVSLATGAEAAMVVNNNAAAVYLVVSSYSPPGRVLISRGELVEIGGSFRLPDILERAGKMIEVGTTNRTYVDDYAKVAESGDILMRAHRSNYDIKGFTHDAALAELVALAKERHCYVVYDIGSGALFDFEGAGIEGEERIADVIASGVDCVTMSGDKLFGGVQAGFIAGRKKFLDGMRGNPLRRAVRVDKITIAALQSLMRSYLFAEDAVADVPVLQQTTAGVAGLRDRAEAVRAALPADTCSAYRVEVADDLATVGGGSFAGTELPSVALVLRCDTDSNASQLARHLRRRALPILSRVKGSEVRINFRSIMPDEDADLRSELGSALGDALEQQGT